MCVIEFLKYILMCIMEFLNEYSGAFTVLLTLVLVIVNIYLGWQNHCLWKDAKRPKVLAEIFVRNHFICYKLVNHGAYPALDIQIAIDPYLIERKMKGDPQREPLERIGTGSFFLAPGGELFLSTGTTWHEIKDHKLSLDYTYEDLSGKPYSESFTFDLSLLDLDLVLNHTER